MQEVLHAFKVSIRRVVNRPVFSLKVCFLSLVKEYIFL